MWGLKWERREPVMPTWMSASFIFEADGVRWAIDMGGEDYDRLEKRGVDLWNGAQGSQRWEVFRYNNKAHNTLTFNDKPQSIKGKVQIKDWRDSARLRYVAMDLTPVYEGQVRYAERAVAMVDDSYAVIEDRVEPGLYYTRMRWTLVTEATPRILSDSVLLLEKGGEAVLRAVASQTPVRVDNPPGRFGKYLRFSESGRYDRRIRYGSDIAASTADMRISDARRNEGDGIYFCLIVY